MIDTNKETSKLSASAGQPSAAKVASSALGAREKILAAVRGAQPSLLPLPEKVYGSGKGGTVAQFQTTLKAIGANVLVVNEDEDLVETIETLFPDAKRMVSSVTTIERHLLNYQENFVHHSLQDVDVAIIEAQFGVAENGAVWVTEDDLKIRVLPFICEHLVAIVDADTIVANMHDAYDRIGSADYGFGVFIAGPSKTADIEQSLVLGAHGPKSMTVMIRYSESMQLPSESGSRH